jgi:hypothetical protein
VDRLLSREDVKDVVGMYGDDHELEAADHEPDAWKRLSKRLSYVDQAHRRANMGGDSAVSDEIYQLEASTQPKNKTRLSDRGDLRRGRQFSEVTP